MLSDGIQRKFKGNSTMPSLQRATAISTAIASAVILFPISAKAQIVDWVDWTLAGTNTVEGNINGNTVTYTGQYAFAITGAGTNYWNPGDPYVSASVSNAPPPSDIIAMSAAGSRTLTFDDPVTDPFFSYVSMNGNTYTFSDNFTLLSGNGVPGFWGAGVVQKSGLQLQALSGEPHGTIQLLGTFDSLTFSVANNENWNGFTVGIARQVPPPPASVPGPLPWLGAISAFAYSRKLRSRITSSSKKVGSLSKSSFLKSDL